MKLEVFTRKQGKESTISCIVLRHETIKLSKALLEQMGSPVWVEFAIDADEKIIGIRNVMNQILMDSRFLLCC